MCENTFEEKKHGCREDLKRVGKHNKWGREANQWRISPHDITLLKIIMLKLHSLYYYFLLELFYSSIKGEGAWWSSWAHRRTKRGAGAPVEFLSGHFRANKQVIFGQNHFNHSSPPPDQNWSHTPMLRPFQLRQYLRQGIFRTSMRRKTNVFL